MKTLITILIGLLVVGCGKPLISIHKAAETGNVKAVKKHLDAGTDVNDKGGAIGTPLIHAVQNGHIEVAKLLISRGANVNMKAEGGWTALHHAVAFSTKEMTELLIKNGAEMDAGTDVKNHSAIFSLSDVEIIILLIESGANVKARNEDGLTPLHAFSAAWHIRSGNPFLTEEILKRLISKGANVNAPITSGEHKGFTPLDLATYGTKKQAKLKGTANLLRKHGGKTGEELKTAIKK